MEYVFPTTPFIAIAIQYWQYLVRAKQEQKQKACMRLRGEYMARQNK